MGLVKLLAQWTSGAMPESFFGTGNSPEIIQSPGSMHADTLRGRWTHSRLAHCLSPRRDAPTTVVQTGCKEVSWLFIPKRQLGRSLHCLIWRWARSSIPCAVQSLDEAVAAAKDLIHGDTSDPGEKARARGEAKIGKKIWDAESEA